VQCKHWVFDNVKEEEMKQTLSRLVGFALVFFLAGILVFIGLGTNEVQAKPGKGKPRPAWEVTIPHLDNPSTGYDLLGHSDTVVWCESNEEALCDAIFDNFQSNDGEVVAVGTVSDTTFALAFQNDPQGHDIKFPVEFNDGVVEGPYCGFPDLNQTVNECGDDCADEDLAEALACLTDFMHYEHTHASYNLYVRVYTMGEPPIGFHEMEEGEGNSVSGGVHIELIGHDTGGEVHDVDCRADGVVITRTGPEEWETLTSGANLQCEEQYWEITQHPRNKNKWIYTKHVSVKANTNFTFKAIWTNKQ
jgi:hypothetical protein